MGSRSPSEDLAMNDADARRKNISKSIRNKQDVGANILALHRHLRPWLHQQQSQIMTSSSTTTSHRVLHQQHYKSWTPYSQVARRGKTTSSTRSARSHDNKHKQQCSRPCTTCWARAKHEKTHKAMKIINELSLV